MGCKKIKRTIFYRKAGKIKKTLGIFIVTTMLIAAITPLVYAANEHSDDITVTFDPSGNIELDISPETANFSAVTFETSVNWPTEGGTDTSYTLYNNGSVAADVFIKGNHSTDSGDMDLQGTPGSITTDEYCLNFTGSNAQQITSTNTSWTESFDADTTITFGINLQLDDGSSDFGWQTTTINITGIINTTG